LLLESEILGVLGPALACVSALVVDRFFGEPRFHHLVWFGRFAHILESRLNSGNARPRGGLAVVLACVVPVALTWYCRFLITDAWGVFVFYVVVLFVVIGW
jgi:adenosylcobinamide-phosphate synthase